MQPATRLKILFAALAVLGPTSARAESAPQVFTRNTERVIRKDSPLPMVLQLGLDGGYLSHTTTIPREGPFTGWMTSGKILGSLLFENWITEAGLGWSYSGLYGKTRSENPSEPEIGHRVFTQSAFAELGLRYRLTQRVNIGLIAQDFFGTDLTLSQRKGLVSNMFLGGAMAAIDLIADSGVFRLGAQLLAEIPDNQRQVVSYAATLQFGIPLKDYDILLRKTDVYVHRERIQKVEIPRVVTKTIVRDVTKYSLPVDAFRFLRGQTTLNPDDQAFVLDLAQTLKQQSANFKHVAIEAAVKAGPDPRRDLQLSEIRAQSIRNAIVSTGHLTANKVSAVGVGGRSNLEDRQNTSWSPTLIDLSFSGLSNPDAVSDALNLMLKRRSTPETCRGDKCK